MSSRLKQIWIALASSLLLTTTAWAGPIDTPSRDLATSEQTREQFQNPASDWVDAPIRLDLAAITQLVDTDDAVEESIELQMPHLPPESLMLRFKVHNMVTVYVTADLTSELARLDAMDGETYWAPGIEFHVTRTLSLFAEDFQSASSITGGGADPDEEPAASRTWDGHQVSFGLQYRPNDQLLIRGEAIAYVLSLTDRGDAVGGMVSLVWVF